MALEAGVMHITLEYAKDLKNRDWFSRQDPYCILQCGTQKFRSKTHVNGAKSPVWNQTFQFQVVNENNLQVTVYDEDTCTKDDIIGTACLSFARARARGSDQVNAPVLSAKGKQHGFVCIRLRFEGNNALRTQGAPQYPVAAFYMAAPSAPPLPLYYGALQQPPQMYIPPPYQAYPQTPYHQQAASYPQQYLMQSQPLHR